MSVPKSTVTTTGHYQASAKGRLIFDSHGYVKRMTDGGFNEQQAEALAAEQAELLGNLATRQDIEAVQVDVQAVKDGLEVVRNELEAVKQNMATRDDLENMAVKYNLENMATKQDLENFATKQDLEIVRKEIEVSAQTLKVEMIKWMTWYFLSGLAVMAAMMTALAAVLKLT